MNSAADIWTRILSMLEQELTPTAVSTWFDDAQAVELDNSRFVIYTPTSFKKDIIQSKYIKPIQNALYQIFAEEMEIAVLTEGELEARQENRENKNILLGSEDYTFERFVVGSSNRFAYNAALAVAEAPAERYNPLFLYGESGLGKTHLIYAISHRVRYNHPEFRVVYVKGDDFTNELIQALRSGKQPEFRAKYREADLLLMDDIQFIAGKDSTQEEFFHTFNTLYEAKKQIVLTADRPPNEMMRLEDRLRTRFEQGLIADVQPPDYETRMAIIKNKALLLGLELPNSVLEYIAENITSNVRQLEGTIKKILAYRELMGATVDTDTVIRAVRDLLKEKDSFMPSPQEIIEETAKFYGLEPDAIRSQSRTKDITTARQISMYLIRNITNIPLADIGKEYGRDHSTVIHSLDKVEKLVKEDRETAEVIKDIKSNINARFS
ncbi:MAG: chromosomal replication initiator protein DnaA [Oscillospiraceae bacterium]|nr:chromosomal replication initiator protein DnaA [Oscillospiraceae bacterium]